MKRAVTPIFAVVLTCIAAPHSFAASITVSKSGPIDTIAAALALANPGDKITVKSGVYQENPVIPIALNDLVLRAKGKVTIEARAVGGAGNGPGITVSAPSVTIVGFVIQNAIGSGIDAAATALDLSVRDCTIRNVSESGIRFASGGTGLTVEDCTFLGMNIAAISVAGPATGVTVSKCVAEGMLTGPFVTATADASTFEKNTVRNCAAGFTLTGSEITVRKNDVSNATTHGVLLTGNDAVITKNTLSATTAGIDIRGEDDAVIKNTLRGCSPGVVITSGDNPTVVGNQINTAAGVGIQVAAPTTTGVIGDNVIEDARSRGIFFGPATFMLTLVGNRVVNCGTNAQAGYFIDGSSHVLLANEAKGCPGDGFVLDGVGGHTLIANLAADSGRDGFDIKPGSEGNTLSDNKATGNGGEGFEHSAGNATMLQSNIGKRNRIDFANDGGAFMTFTGNTSDDGTSSLPGLPEID